MNRESDDHLEVVDFLFGLFNLVLKAQDLGVVLTNLVRDLEMGGLVADVVTTILQVKHFVHVHRSNTIVRVRIRDDVFIVLLDRGSRDRDRYR